MTSIDQTPRTGGRSGPIRFTREIAAELRAARWPTPRRIVATTAVVTAVVAVIAGLVHTSDVGLQSLITWLSSLVTTPAAGFVRVGLRVIQALSLVAAGAVLLRHPGPSVTGNLFGASAGDADTGPATDTQRRLHLVTAAAVTAFTASSLVLAVLS